MILYEGGEDIPLREVNRSTKYATGSLCQSNNYGTVKVVGQVNTPTKKSDGNRFIHFIVEFCDGTKVVIDVSGFITGKIKNPNKPIIYKVGFFGQGIYTTQTHPKEYAIWHSMLQRCYSTEENKNNLSYKDCIVDKRWHNFQNFCEDVKHLKGYSEWKKGQKDKRNKYELDKDIKVKGNRVYGRNTCILAHQSENLSMTNRRGTMTGLIYIATRMSDAYIEEFTKQKEFCKKYDLNTSTVCTRLKKNNTAPYKGWIFAVKEES